MERIELTYNAYKNHILASTTKNLPYQHIITSTGGDRYFFLFAPDGDAILYVSFINEATQQSNVDDYEANYADKANRQIEDRNKTEKWFTSYANFVDEFKKRGKTAFLNTETLGSGSDTAYLISFQDGNLTFKYKLEHSNTDEKNDYDINYLTISDKTIDVINIHNTAKHFEITNTNTINLWTPAQNYSLHLTSFYFYGYCIATSAKKFIFDIEAYIDNSWVKLAGLTVYNKEESFREYIDYTTHIETTKGINDSPRLRAKVSGDVTLGNYKVNLTITGFEAK